MEVKAAASTPLVVFDFDFSLIDENSDPWTVKQLSPDLHSQMGSLYKRGVDTWSGFMDRMMGMVWEKGFNKEQIKAALSDIPFHPDMIKALELANAQGAEIVVMSAANDFFIETILSNYNVRHHFVRVHTHSAVWEESGRMRVVGCHQPSKTETKTEGGMTFTASHSCPTCPSDLCKGTLLDSYLVTGRYGPVLYIGDSVNDFCPSTRLGSDHVLARKDMPLHKLIQKQPDKIKGTVHVWNDGTDVLAIFQKVLCAATKQS